jgi:hypothetical protein
MGEVVAESANDTTEKLAPQGPVHEIGKVLLRLLQFMAETPADQAIRLSKVDLSDGFWRLIVEPEQKCFCYVMPDEPGARLRIVVPSALQMGWAESPACFCAATETVQDSIDLLLREKVDLPEHRLETFMAPMLNGRVRRHRAKSTRRLEYMLTILCWHWSRVTTAPSSDECPEPPYMPSTRYSRHQRYRDMWEARIQYRERSSKKGMHGSMSRKRFWGPSSTGSTGQSV